VTYPINLISTIWKRVPEQLDKMDGERAAIGEEVVEACRADAAGARGRGQVLRSPITTPMLPPEVSQCQLVC